MFYPFLPMRSVICSPRTEAHKVTSHIRAITWRGLSNIALIPPVLPTACPVQVSAPRKWQVATQTSGGKIPEIVFKIEQIVNLIGAKIVLTRMYSFSWMLS